MGVCVVTLAEDARLWQALREKTQPVDSIDCCPCLLAVTVEAVQCDGAVTLSNDVGGPEKRYVLDDGILPLRDNLQTLRMLHLFFRSVGFPG